MNFISLNALLLILLNPLSSVAGSSAYDAFDIAKELETQFDCKHGSVTADEKYFSNGSPDNGVKHCRGYYDMFFEVPYGLYELPFSYEQPFYVDVDEMVNAANDGQTHFESLCWPSTIVTSQYAADAATDYGHNAGCPYQTFECHPTGADSELSFAKYDEDCLRDTFEKVNQFRTKMDLPIGTRCRDLEADIQPTMHIDNTFSALDWEEGEEATDKYDFEGYTLVFDKYVWEAESERNSYQNSCLLASGQFHQIVGRAQCIAWWNKEDGYYGQDYSEEVYVYIDRRPVCYSVECSAEDYEGLLRVHTLSQTELRLEREYPGLSVTCDRFVREEDQWDVWWGFFFGYPQH